MMKSKFGAGRDFEVLGEDDERRYFVDGKMGSTPKAEILGPDGTGSSPWSDVSWERRSR
jgi:hypothetical protein